MPEVLEASNDVLTLTNEQVEEQHLSLLPESLRIAQKAVETKEVQRIIEQLSHYNLGVCMPHMHIQEGEFSELPAGMVSMEVKSDFIEETEADQVNSLPVVWHWKKGTVMVAGRCHVNRRRCDSGKGTL